MTDVEVHADSDGDANRRIARRHRVIKKGQLLFSGGLSADCLVRDVSPTGMRLRLSEEEQHPPTLVTVLLNEDRVRGEVAWQVGNEIGIHFKDRTRPELMPDGSPGVDAAKAIAETRPDQVIAELAAKGLLKDPQTAEAAEQWREAVANLIQCLCR